MWVKNWYENYDKWRLHSSHVRLWGDHNYIWYHRELDELLQTTMLEF
jgi:hypothetical protein